MDKSLYDVLEVAPTSSPDVIRDAYERLRKQYANLEPDGFALEHMAAIELAYNVLSDPAKRKAYGFGKFESATDAVNSIDESVNPGEAQNNASRPLTESTSFKAFLVVSAVAIFGIGIYALQEHETAKIFEEANQMVERDRQRESDERLTLQIGLNKLAGTDTAQDFAAAYNSLKELAEKPDRKGVGVPCRAAAELGIMFLEGKGVSKNPVEAAIWFRKAISQPTYLQGPGGPDNFPALMLGKMYGAGDGFQRDLEQAYAWFNIAAAQHVDNAGAYSFPAFLERKAEAIMKRDALAAQLSPERLLVAQKLPSSRSFWGLSEESVKK